MSTVPSGYELTGSHSSVHPSPLPILPENYYPAGVPRRLSYPNYPAWGLLAQTAAKVPDRVATDLFGTKLTYAEIHGAATRLAAWLQQQGLERGNRVGVLLSNMPEYLIALNGIWRAGGVAVAISPMSVADEVAELLGATDCHTVICLDVLTGLLEKSPHVGMTLLVSMSEYLPTMKKAGYLAARWQRTGQASLSTGLHQQWFWEAIESSDGMVNEVTIDPVKDAAYIISTGGCLERSRSVTLSHRNIVANAWQQSEWGATANGITFGSETMLAMLPFFHCYGMSTTVAGGVVIGATIVIQPRFDARKIINAIEQHRPTLFHAVPALLSALNKRLSRPQSRRVDLSSLKWVISGGAPLPVPVAEEFARYSGAMVVEGYGMSEASPVTHVGPLDGNNRWGTIGLPLPDTNCRIVDQETGTRDVRLGEVGELLISGPQVMLGYWENPVATAVTIRHGWLFTGDLATLDSDGFYRIVGRKKDLIITSGFNVYPADVERVLLEYEMVADVAVVGMPDDERGEIVTAFVVLKEGCRWQPEKLTEYCRLHLAAHRRPRRWKQVMGELPRDEAGKVLREQLRDKCHPERSEAK